MVRVCVKVSEWRVLKREEGEREEPGERGEGEGEKRKRTAPLSPLPFPFPSILKQRPRVRGLLGN